MKNAFWLSGVLVVLCLIIFAGCQSDTQRIRATNEAIDRPNLTSTSAAISAEIPSIDIEEGDCINSKLTEGITFDSVDIVPCTETWQFRVLNLFQFADSENYPGEGVFSELAYEHCDTRFSTYVYPPSESWSMGGSRRIACLQRSFGLVGSDPAKLDRLVNPFSLSAGSCFNRAPESNNLLVESVSCSGEWEYRIINTFEADWPEEFPGQQAIAAQALEKCDRRSSQPFYPLAEKWSLGERSVLCAQESFGLSVSGPGKLDRLVSEISLRFGECYNGAPETRNELVELVNCSSEWEYRVVERIDIAETNAYPGENFFEQQAIEQCPESFDFYMYPILETWKIGHRVVHCLEEGF